MASCFGEVVETSSRAYGGDYYDVTDLSDVLKSEYDISWNSPDRPDELEFIIVTIGKCCQAFSSLLRQKSSPELIAKIVQVPPKDSKEESTVRRRKQVPSCIYKLKQGVLLCEVSPDVQIIHANRFTAKLHELLSASKEVIILTSLTSNRYVSWRAYSPPFTKGLATSTYSTKGKELLAPQLETPNIVSGVAASVLIFCEIKKIPGCLYVCYTPKEEMDSAIFYLLQKLLSQVPSVKTAVEDIHFESKDVDCFTHRAGNLYL